LDEESALKIFKQWVLAGILVGLIVIGISYAVSLYPVKRATVAHGVLDLTGWDWQRDETVELDGEWEFYWRQLLTPGDFSRPALPASAHATMIRVPGYWNDYGLLDKNGNACGFATYRLKIRLKPGVAQLGLQIPPIYTSYKLWVNGRLLATAGRVGPDPAASIPYTREKEFFFTVANRNNLEIVIQVANFSHWRGGILGYFRLGAAERIYRDKIGETRVSLSLIICIFSIGIFSFGFSRSKDDAAVFFSFFCICQVLYWMTYSYGEILLLDLFPGLDWSVKMRLEYLSLYLSHPLCFSYFTRLYPNEAPKIFAKLFFYIIGALALVIIVTPPLFFVHTLFFYHFLLGLAFLVLVWILAKAIIRKREEACLIALGAVLIILTGVTQVFVVNWMLWKPPLFFPIGICGFLFIQAIALGIRTSRMNAEVEALSRELQRKNEALSQLDEIKDEFLANTSHELRTPLFGIIGIAESLLAGVAGTLSGAAVDNLKLLIASGQRLTVLVNDIMDFSRLKQKDLLLRIQGIDLRVITEIVIRSIQPLTLGKPLRFRNEVTSGLPLVQADEDRLQQILHNLLGNAIKFTPAGEIIVDAKQDGDSVIVTVSDTGIGISAAKLERVFESFEQADASLSREYGGAGLGLSITRQLVELHHGKIWVESEVGRGSRFHFTLPLETKKTAGGPGLAREKEEMASGVTSIYETVRSFGFISNPPEGAAAKILIVDDEPVNLQVLINQLSLRNYGLLVAAGGEEALEIVEREGANLDLAILDVMMPRISGYEVCRKIREQYSPDRLPVIFLTARNHFEHLVEGFEAGANDYLAKPVSGQELIARVEVQLRLVGLNRELKMANEQLSRSRKELQNQRDNLLYLVVERAKELSMYHNIKKQTARLEAEPAAADENSKAPAALLRVNCFGPFNVYGVQSGEYINWRRVRVKEIFAYLTHHRNEWVLLDRLLEQFWPEDESQQATGKLHTTLYHLRKVLKQHRVPEEIRLLNGAYQLTPGIVDCDSERFEQLVKTGLGGEQREALAAVEEALKLYKGQYFQDINLPWVIPERERYEIMYIMAVKQWSQIRMSVGEYGRVAECLLKLLQTNPLLEEIHLLLMEAYAGMKDISKLVSQYKTLRTILNKELGVEPAPETRKQYEAWYRQLA
jgi:two-component system sensor histidine kinase ChiS